MFYGIMNAKMQNHIVNNDVICSNNKSERQLVEFSEKEYKKGIHHRCSGLSGDNSSQSDDHHIP